MSYAEFKGTLCSSEVTGGEKTFYIQPSPTGYYAYTVTVTTYKCAFASCLGGFDYTIHIVIREVVTGQTVYSDEWKVPFNPNQKTTTTFTVYFPTPLQPNTSYTMTWWTAQVDGAGGCFGVGCILCADIDMLLWQVSATPTPTPTPTPIPTPTPTPVPTPTPTPTYPPTPTPTSPPPTYPPPPSPTPTVTPPPWSPPPPTPTITPPPYSPTPTPTVSPPPTATLPWYFWALLGAAFGLGIGLIVVEATRQRR